jgi:adenylate kinase
MQKQLNLVLFGPPGAGKGTQSELIIERYNLTHISTGDLFRKHLGEGTALGMKAQGYMDNGKLVPDEIVIGMVEDKIKSTTGSNGFIFDGFPRTVPQAESLDSLLESVNSAISVMVMLEVDEEELKARLRNRAKVSGRTDDQDEEKIKTRILEYREKTLPVAAFYKSQNKLVAIDGVGSIETIFGNISNVLDPLSQIA